MKFNNFLEDLNFSLDCRDDEIFDNLYFRAFKTLKRVELVEDLDLQRKGIDKKLHFENGKTVLIDEKKRRKDYGDILLEEYSVWERKVVGWLGRHIHTDYIVYAFMDTGRVHLFPFLLLQRAWIKNYHQWLADFGRKFAINNGYKTSSIPIPTDILLFALKDAGEEQL